MQRRSSIRMMRFRIMGFIKKHLEVFFLSRINIIPYTRTMSALTTTRGLSIYQAYSPMKPPTKGYQTNNQYSHFPPKMNDGRSVLASWQPGAVVNDTLMKDAGVKTNWQYRRFLSENADDILRKNFMYSCNDTGYFIRNETMGMEVPSAFSHPALYSTAEEPVKHLGASRSDIKETYLSREQLEAKRVIPTMTQDELIRKWGNVVSK